MNKVLKSAGAFLTRHGAGLAEDGVIVAGLGMIFAGIHMIHVPAAWTVTGGLLLALAAIPMLRR